MKKLLSFFGIISIMGGSFAPLVAWKTQLANTDITQDTINKKNVNINYKNLNTRNIHYLQNIQNNLNDDNTKNTFKFSVQEFGSSSKLYKAPRRFYANFYMNGAVYNWFSLMMKDNYVGPGDRQFVYDNFLGEQSGSMSDRWKNVIFNYNIKLNKLNAAYQPVDAKGKYIKFQDVLKNFLLNSENFAFLRALINIQHQSTNIYPYSKFEKPPVRIIKDLWRRSGILLKIPFVYDGVKPTKDTWRIDKFNLRIFPQLGGCDIGDTALGHYYLDNYNNKGVMESKPPYITVKTNKDLPEVRDIIPQIYEAFREYFSLKRLHLEQVMEQITFPDSTLDKIISSFQKDVDINFSHSWVYESHSYKFETTLKVALVNWHIL